MNNENKYLYRTKAIRPFDFSMGVYHGSLIIRLVLKKKKKSWQKHYRRASS